MAIYNKRLVGGFVKSLISGGCLSPENAKTITDLGYGTDWFIKNALSTDNVLRRLVVRVGTEAPADAGVDAASEGETETSGKKKPLKASRSGREDIDFSTARFYIPEELKYRAEVRYASRGTDFFALGICVVIFAAAAFAAIFIIPELIQLIDNFIGTL